MKNITAVILSAGEGKRIKPIVTSKGLISFLGKPMISWLIEDLSQVGIKNFVVVVSPKVKDQYQAILKEGIKLAVQKEPKGMADALLSAHPKVKTNSILVVNAADFLATPALKGFINQIKKTDPKILLSGLKVNRYLPGGYFKLKEGKPVAIVEKPGEGKEPSPFFNIVLHYFKDAKEFINSLKTSKSTKDDLYEVALSSLMKKDSVDLFKYTDYFGQIKYPHQVLDVSKLFLSHRLTKKNSIHPTAKIMSGAVIKNSYIGKDVVIGNNSLIRDSNIEEGSVVGYNTEIARSYVGPKSYFHCNYVGDSVVEGHSNMGSGARLANYRFDEKEVLLKKDQQKIPTGKTKLGAILAKGVKLGINVSIMPGVTLKKDSIVGAGEVVK